MRIRPRRDRFGSERKNEHSSIDRFLDDNACRLMAGASVNTSARTRTVALPTGCLTAVAISDIQYRRYLRPRNTPDGMCFQRRYSSMSFNSRTAVGQLSQAKRPDAP